MTTLPLLYKGRRWVKFLKFSQKGREEGGGGGGSEFSHKKGSTGKLVKYGDSKKELSPTNVIQSFLKISFSHCMLFMFCLFILLLLVFFVFHRKALVLADIWHLQRVVFEKEINCGPQ